MICWYVLRISRNSKDGESTRIVGKIEAPTHYRAMEKAAQRFSKPRLHWWHDKDGVRATPYLVVQSKISYEIEQEEEEIIRAGRMKRPRKPSYCRKRC